MNVFGLEEKEEGASGEPPILTRMKRYKKSGQKMPTCVIVVGMAGSGKTTLMTQLQRSLSAGNQNDDDDEEGAVPSRQQGYCLNLDPATKLVPFGASIDIRDTVDYKEVMRQHGLGPNGAIMTSLNLFTTKFDQVISILEKRAYGEEPAGHAEQEEEESEQVKEEEGEEENNDNKETVEGEGEEKKEVGGLEYVLVDTPGQIEAFTWSASGTIISEALASSFPTVLAFVVDTPRCAASPNTFMSNMLYACSMLYRTRLPIVIVFNKTDVVPHDFCHEWMTDYETFQEALDNDSTNNNNTNSSYYSSLTRSLSLVLDEFYNELHHCGVSAATGDGVDDFWKAVDLAAQDFETDYLQDLQNRIDEQNARKEAIARDSVKRLSQDIAQDDTQEER